MKQLHIKSDKHIFSFYYLLLQSTDHTRLIVTEESFVHRLYHVLRYQVGDECKLFNKELHAYVIIQEISKKNIIFTIKNIQKNRIFHPNIVLLLPILKKESLEEAVYNAVVAGVSVIQLVVTQKCHRYKLLLNEFERLLKIVIAACEQSHYYDVPLLHAPLTLEQALATYSSNKLFFADPNGLTFSKIVWTSNILLIIGPEGDLTSVEKDILQQHSVQLFSLTPTILRSQEAVLLSIGMIRSI